MRAIWQDRFCDPVDLELREVERPTPGDGEVLVRVHAASVHPDVWQVVTGRPYAARLLGAGLRSPKGPIPGTDLAGEVVENGPGAGRFSAGDAVFGETIVTDQWVNGGAFADYAAVPEQLLAPKPSNVSFEQAACVPTSGYIVLLNLRDLSGLDGAKVLVNGAGGGVGLLAMQLLAAHGATITAVDRKAKLGVLRELGASKVIDCDAEDFTQGEQRYQLIFDVPGNYSFRKCRRVLDEDGRYVLIGHEAFGASGRKVLGILPYFFRLMLQSRFVPQLQGPKVAAPTRTEAQAMYAELMENGRLTPHVDSVFEPEQVGEAFARLQSGLAIGKVVLRFAHG